MQGDLDQLLTEFITAEHHGAAQKSVAARALIARLGNASVDELATLASAAVANDVASERLAALLPDVVLADRAEPRDKRARLAPSTVAALAKWYQRLGASNSARSHLLRLLATDGGASALAAWAELIARDPPRSNEEVDRAFVPLFRRRDIAIESVFPRLFDAIAHPQVAAAVLDTANYATRSGLAGRHPASDRVADLAALLGQLVQQLERWTEAPPTVQDAAAVSRQLNEATGLVIALCDAIGLVGDRSVAGKLYPALALPHRALRCEAAAALARLGDERGVEELVRLAAEPVVRSRVLAYAGELGVLEQVDEPFRTPESRAEGDLAAWLARPMQVGLAPQEIELVDQCRQFWPGYDEPVDCFLFSFEYRLPTAAWSGIGIAGPLIHSLPVDLEDFPPGDIYALYAGWQAEHEAITLGDAGELSPAESARHERRVDALIEAGFETPRLVAVGRFFEETHAIFVARLGRQTGTVIVDDDGATHWFPTGSISRPLTVELAYAMHKGRKLLRSFNPERAAP